MSKKTKISVRTNFEEEGPTYSLLLSGHEVINILLADPGRVILFPKPLW